jgi:glycosyltransferase involved in cell wall biosynthesis
MNDSEINELYNHPKVKAMVSLTKGEGFGRPLLEFSSTGKPIIASNWSGHTDFLHPEFNKLVGGTLTPVHKSAVVKDVILPESNWFTPDDGEVGKAFREVHKNYKQYSELGKRQAYRTNKEYTLEEMTNLLGNILDQNIPEFPKQVELKLPELKLPKLK